VVALAMFFAMKGGSSMLGPIQNQYLNDNVKSVGRATLLSSVAMLRQVAGIPFRVGSGVLADMFSTIEAVAILGGVFLVGWALMWGLVPPISRDYDPSAGSQVSTESGAAED